MLLFSSFLVVFVLALLTSGCKPSGPAVMADVIYVGGPIVTVNDAQPNAEALAVKGGNDPGASARGPRSRRPTRERRRGRWISPARR